MLRVDNDTYVAYDSETGLKVKETQIAEMPDGSKMPQTTFYEDYKSVDGVLFPHVIKMPIGPQNLAFRAINITVNPQVSESDFNIEN